MPLTVRDIMETDVPPVYPEDPMFLESTKKFEERLRKAIAWLAQDVMTEDPVTIPPDATVGEAARHKHNRLPVVEHGRLVGVVTRIDVLDVLTAE